MVSRYAWNLPRSAFGEHPCRVHIRKADIKESPAIFVVKLCATALERMYFDSSEDLSPDFLDRSVQ